MRGNSSIVTEGLTRGVLAAVCWLAATAAMAQSIKGTATYKERMALPSSAIFEAALEDVSRADAPATVVGSTRVTSPGNPPIAFTITYDQAKIAAERRYVVRGRILVDGKVLFTSETAVPVITRGSPTEVALLLRRVSAGQKPPAPRPSEPPATLQGTSWRLVRFQGGDDTTKTPDDRDKYTIEFDPGGLLTARIDCNRGRGSWKSSGSKLELGPMALTRAMCPPGSLDGQIVKHWSLIRSYVIKDGHLFLALMADGGIYEFELVPVGVK